MDFERLVGFVRERFRNSGKELPSATFQFNITGEGGGAFFVTTQNKSGLVEVGTCAEPDASVSINFRDAVELLEGRANPVSLYFERRIRVEGDLSLALSAASVFR